MLLFAIDAILVDVAAFPVKSPVKFPAIFPVPVIVGEVNVLLVNVLWGTCVDELFTSRFMILSPCLPEIFVYLHDPRVSAVSAYKSRIR